MAAAGTPSSSGARLAGDDYQHLLTWMAALHLLRDASGVSMIEFEAPQAGNVDDLIWHFDGRAPRYEQIKFARHQGTLLDAPWFTTQTGTKTPLQRFQQSYTALATDGAEGPQMVLQTNRQVDGNDALLGCLDGLTNKLTPALGNATPRSRPGRVRAEWAEHLEVEEPELLDLLDHLEVKPGREGYDDLVVSCGLLMEAVGLRGDADAVNVGKDEIRRMVIRAGRRTLERADVETFVDEKELVAADRRATLLVQGIDHDPWPEGATVSLDWVALHEGDTAVERRRLHDPSNWTGAMANDLVEARESLEREGYRDVQVTGHYRLSSAMAVGATLVATRGFQLAADGRDGIWATTTEPATFEVEEVPTTIGQGDDLAVALSVSVDIADDVVASVQRANLPVGTLLHIFPAAGTDSFAIGDNAAAAGWAQAVIKAIRAGSAGAQELHLFLACPRQAAVLLGHRWNRMLPTQLYDDRGPQGGYDPSFRLPG